VALFLFLSAAATASAQTALNVRALEFVPPDAHFVQLSDGRPAVTRYDIEVANATTAQVLQRVTVGKPPLQADGMVRTDLAAAITVTPVAGAAYVANVITVGPLGSSLSARSNPFTFAACEFAVTASTAAFPAAGASGSLTVTATGTACSWTAQSSASWLTITSGTSGIGTGTIAFTVAPNASTQSRTASIAVGGKTYTVTQSAAALQTINVATVAELQAAVANLTSNTTVVIAPGVYRLTGTLRVNGPLTGVVLRGSTGRPADVVIEGAGMTTAGKAPTAVWVSGAVDNLRIADVTIRRFYQHALLFESAVRSPRVSNVQLIDTGGAMVKANAGQDGSGVANGVVENSWLGYTTTGASAAAGGIDLRAARAWTIRANEFRNVRGPSGPSAAAVVAANGSIDTNVDRNQFVNCAAAIALGLADRVGSTDHAGGAVTNNFVYRAAAVSGGAAISVTDSPNTMVAHNTVVLSGASASAIETRFADATGIVVANNLTDAAILARDGASVTQTGNVTTATPDLFIKPAAGDLHLAATAAAVLDMGDGTVNVPADVDGQARPADGGPDVGADEILRTNAAPTVQVVDPVPNLVVRQSTGVRIEAAAADADGAVAYVELYVGSTLLARTTGAPYTATWQANQTGVFSITAVAVDNVGGRTVSSPVTVTVKKKVR
jgi:hypothetical protein